ncbi:MAG: hypothetical protein H0V17_07580 [Deltaproteobacteria bacterium]|nr:hypothetical protein [Deltaproteobacteria bacterium]
MSSVIARLAVASAVLAAHPALAAPAEALPLAEIRDDKQLSDALTSITKDPAILVDHPQKRSLAQALMIEGVKQLQAKAYDQALANFLEAYGKFPSPKILLEVGSTLREMGRLADAANTYQRYLSDPLTAAVRVVEVKEVLRKLDEQLTILTIRVAPRMSSISIDAGTFITVGSSLVTRVRPGIHLVRIKNGDKTSEVTVNGFEGETKEVLASLPVDGVGPDLARDPPKPPPDHQEGWLITGQYASHGGTNERSVLASTAGDKIRPIVPVFDLFEDGRVEPRPTGSSISAGVLGVVRIDAEGRGVAGGIGVAISRGRFEGDVLLLRSNQTGGYLGLRYRILTGLLRPYVSAGIPGFVFDNTSTVNMIEVTETKLAIGARVAGGLELFINGHVSVQADLGFEHFWFVDNTPFVANVWVPTLGVIGRI